MELWGRSDILHAHMESLVKHGLLARTEALEWVVFGDEEVPMLPDGYVVSFIPFYERRLMASPTDSSGDCCIIMHQEFSPMFDVKWKER
jgi:hypothetical protein